MAVLSDQFEISKSESNLLVPFIPSVDREGNPVDQDTWGDRTLEMLGQEFGGATAFPKAKGVWRDDAQGGKLIFDEPVVVQCYTNEEALEEHVHQLRQFLVRMGTETNQGPSAW